MLAQVLLNGGSPIAGPSVATRAIVHRDVLHPWLHECDSEAGIGTAWLRPTVFCSTMEYLLLMAMMADSSDSDGQASGGAGDCRLCWYVPPGDAHCMACPLHTELREHYVFEANDSRSLVTSALMLLHTAEPVEEDPY